jgi:hypothetical protein
MLSRVLSMVAVLGLVAGCRSATHPSVTGEPDLGAMDMTPALLPTLLKVAPNEQLALEVPQGPTKYSLKSLRELYLRLQTATPPSGVQWLTLEVFDPMGGLYESSHAPFTLDGTPAEVSAMDGIPHPVRVHQVKTLAGGYGYDQTLIVGGTNMTRYPRPGLWRIKAALVDQPSVAGEVIVELGMFQ